LGEGVKLASDALQTLRERQLHWPFDRRAYPNYVIVLALTMLGLALLWLRGFTIAPRIFLEFFSWALLMIFGGWGLRRIGWPNFGGAMEATGMFYWQGLSTFFCIVPLATLPIPFKDSLLASWDHALGFDWVAYAKATADFYNPFAKA
jgi:hypothetical protein